MEQTCSEKVESENLLPVVTVTHRVHLTIAGQFPVPEVFSYGYGIDYYWNADQSTYQCRPIRWVDDASYAAYQAGDDMDDYAYASQSEGVCRSFPDVSWDDDNIPF